MKLYFIIAVSVLIAFCIVSHIVARTTGGYKSRIAFGVVAVVCFAASAFMQIVLLEIVRISFFDSVCGDWLCVLLTTVLCAVSAAEVGGLLQKEPCKIPTAKTETATCEASTCDCAVTLRSKNKRLHGDYTIVKD